MRKGEQLDQVRFPQAVREELRKALDGHDPEVIEAIIPELEDLATSATTLTPPAAKEIRMRRWRRVKILKAVRLVVRELERDNVDDLLTLALQHHGEPDPDAFLHVLREQLTLLDRTLTGLLPTVPKRKPGKKADFVAEFLVDETTRILQRAGVPITHYEDGARAKTLRVLWPVVLRREWPTELRHWFKPAISRRK
jgi:hypothetical protein